MESVFGFMRDYLKTTSFFVDGETHNQKESMIFWHFQSVAGCARLFMLVRT